MNTLRLTLGVLVAILLYNCGSGASPKGLQETNNPLSADPILLTKTLTYSLETDPDEGTLIYTAERTVCSGGSASTIIDTLGNYLSIVDKGKLHLWDTTACEAMRWGGGNPNSLGNWSFDSIEAFPIDDLESRLDPNCESVHEADWQGVSMEITSRTISLTSVVDSFCLTRDVGVFQELLDRGLNGASLAVFDCQNFTVTSSTQKTGGLQITQFNLQDSSYTLAFTYNEKSCSLEVGACGEQASFSLCVLGSGLFQ